MISTTDVDNAQRALNALDQALAALDDLIAYARRQEWQIRVGVLRTARARIANERADLERLFT